MLQSPHLPTSPSPHLPMDFVVIDTEGKPELSELAIVNSQGKLIYEGFSENHPKNGRNTTNLKSLNVLLTEFLHTVQDKKIICHYAKHDIDVLRYSFQKAGLKWPNLNFECTWTLATNYWEGLASYSLEYLSKHLNLRVNNNYFIHDLAHSARYDAEFTYYLYRQLMLEPLKKQPNPFSSSRVDTPFQTHPDYSQTYHTEFLNIKLILNDIKLDRNRQSKGVVIIGEPGSGKTHLMMRLTQERLSSNRLLFIRQPNHAQAVLHHIYSRILESLVEKVGFFTQLDSLIINSFCKILSTQIISKKDQEVLKALQDKNLEALGAEGTQRKREYWLHIEKRINEWWIKYYSAGGFAPSILKGIIKYCSYTDSRRKDITTRWLAGNILPDEEVEIIGLPNWREDFSQETFALEAISVLGKLSLLDEPLIIIFDQLEGLGLSHNREILSNFGEAIKEIFTHVPNSLIILNLFPDRWEQFKGFFDNSIIGRISQHQIYLKQPTKSELTAILQVKLQNLGIPPEQLFSAEDLDDILEQKSIRSVLNRAADYYNYRIRQIPLPAVKESLHKLDNNEKLAQELLNLKQQQEIIQKTLFSLIQSIQKSNSIDLSNLGQIAEPQVTSPQIPPNIIEYLTQQKTFLEQEYNYLPIISDYDDMGKLKTIAEALNCIKPIKLTQYRLGKRVLPEHIVIETDQRNYIIGFLQVSPTSFTPRIKNFNELVILYRNDTFALYRDERLTPIKAKVAVEEISKINNMPNAKFTLFRKNDRIYLELIYKLIIDIQNRDLEVDLEAALKFMTTHQEWYHWLLNIGSGGRE